VILPTDRGPASRAYRMLRAQVLQRARARGLRSIGIVSAVAGEGKTLTAINLAMSLAAEPNQNVALVDLDFRHPSIARTLGVTPPRGLDDWLYDGASLASTMYRLEGVERLQLVPTLMPVAASSEALASDRIRDLIGGLRARHESQLLVVDQPPALLSDDVLTLAPLLDGYPRSRAAHRHGAERLLRFRAACVLSRPCIKPSTAYGPTLSVSRPIPPSSTSGASIGMR
jgi:Mrp family chromosome partitioning ATPase